MSYSEVELRDSISPPLPLEILIPASVSILIFFGLTAVIVHRMCRARDAHTKRLARSPSIQAFADRERNRKWLEELVNIKELGLGVSRKGKGKAGRDCDLEVKCQGQGQFEDDVPLLDSLTRPQSAYFPGHQSLSSSFSSPRTLWKRFPSLDLRIPIFSKQSNANFHNRPQVPEIRITVPASSAGSALTNHTDAVLAHHRVWSEIFERDVGLAISGLLDARAQSRPPAYTTTSTPSFSHPPNSMYTLPSPARRRLASASTPNFNITLRLGNGQHYPLGALSPIREARESWCSSARSSLVSTDSALVCKTGITEERDSGIDLSMSSSASSVASSPARLFPQSAARAARGPPPPRSRSSPLLPTSIPNSSSPIQETGRGVTGPRHSVSAPGFSRNLQSAESLASSTSESESIVSMSACSVVLSDLSPASARSFQPPPFNPASTPVSASVYSLSSPTSSPDMSSSSPEAPSALFTPLEAESSSGSSFSFDVTPDTNTNKCESESTLPTPFIPSSYTCSTAQSSIASYVASPCSPVKSADATGSIPHICQDAQSSTVTLSGMAGVELWVDDDVDLFYYSGTDTSVDVGEAGVV